MNVSAVNTERSCCFNVCPAIPSMGWSKTQIILSIFAAATAGIFVGAAVLTAAITTLAFPPAIGIAVGVGVLVGVALLVVLLVVKWRKNVEGLAELCKQTDDISEGKRLKQAQQMTVGQILWAVEKVLSDRGVTAESRANCLDLLKATMTPATCAKSHFSKGLLHHVKEDSDLGKFLQGIDDGSNK